MPSDIASKPGIHIFLRLCPVWIDYDLFIAENAKDALASRIVNLPHNLDNRNAAFCNNHTSTCLGLLYQLRQSVLGFRHRVSHTPV